jgi:hypothetical protein
VNGQEDWYWSVTVRTIDGGVKAIAVSGSPTGGPFVSGVNGWVVVANGGDVWLACPASGRTIHLQAEGPVLQPLVAQGSVWVVAQFGVMRLGPAFGEVERVSLPDLAVEWRQEGNSVIVVCDNGVTVHAGGLRP